MNSFNKPHSNNIQPKQSKFPNQEFQTNENSAMDNILISNTKKLNEFQESFSNINRQIYDIGRNQGNSSNYVPNESMFLMQQNSNFYGPGFLRTPHSPEQMKTNVNYLNLYENDVINHQNIYEDNFQMNIPKNTNVSTNANINMNTNNLNLLMQQDQQPNSSYGMSSVISQIPTIQNQGSNYFPDGIEPKLQNIVSTANFKCQLDLREIALKAKNAEYNPKRFAAVIMRIREPKTTALIFGSGKMVCTGARSEDESKTAAKQYARIIKKLGFPVKFSEFKIQNIVGSCDVKFPIRLEGLSNEHARFCNYEPELFPGLIYRMIKPKIVLLIFVSGKIVLTGAKERNDIFEAFKKIYPVLLTYKKKDNSSTCVEINSVSEE